MWEVNWTVKKKVPQNWIKRAVEAFEKKFRSANQQISIAVVGEDRIRKLNRIYRSKDKSTNVLSFPDSENPLGEIILCLPVIRREAKIYRQSLKSYFQYILIHGLLHLVDFDHKTDRQAEKMENQEQQLLKKL